MIIEYKKTTKITELLKSKFDSTKFKESGWLEKIGFKSIKYPDLYIHTGTLNLHAKSMIENSKLIIVNSTITKEDLCNKLNVKKENIHVIFPINDVKKFKKSEVKKEFYKKYKLDSKTLIIYFTAQNFKRNGFESFCDIVSNLEAKGSSVFVTCTNDSELVYAKEVIISKKLEDNITIIKNEIFDIADIFLLPTINKNVSHNVIKAISNKCVAFVPQSNNSIEFLDIFSIMDDANDSNTSYKIDMLIRVPDEFKKVRKALFKIGKKLNNTYLEKEVNKIIDLLETKN